MNAVKKYLGIIWMLLSPALVVFMLWQAVEKISSAPVEAKANTGLQWSIILLVFIPVCAGLFLFGRYAWSGAYTHLPKSSEEIEED